MGTAPEIKTEPEQESNDQLDKRSSSSEDIPKYFGLSGTPLWVFPACNPIMVLNCFVRAGLQPSRLLQHAPSCFVSSHSRSAMNRIDNTFLQLATIKV